jgi:hypothetical protein
VTPLEEKFATAPIVEDGEWYEPTENPFIHGCCDCGLAHRVEFTIEGTAVSFRYSRDLEATVLLKRRLAEDAKSSRLPDCIPLELVWRCLGQIVRITGDPAAWAEERTRLIVQQLAQTGADTLLGIYHDTEMPTPPTSQEETAKEPTR